MRCSPAVGLILALAAAPLAAEPAARLVDRFAWTMDEDWFGGWSGLELSADGHGMVAITDRGILLRARLHREDGRIVAVVPTGFSRLKSSSGQTLRGAIRDSEGLAVSPELGVAISFEGVHRVVRYASDDAPATPLPRPPGARTMPGNGGLEALAVDPLGCLLAIPEDVRTATGDIPVYRWDGTAWSQPFILPKRGRFLPVGADFGPDERLYLLERAVGFIGFRSRLRRWTVADDGATNEETLFETRTGTHDNLEGVAIWRDSGGRLRATLIADDNFLSLQTTEIVEYALPD